jgi:hypothetical protein
MWTLAYGRRRTSAGASGLRPSMVSISAREPRVVAAALPTAPLNIVLRSTCYFGVSFITVPP